MLDFMRRKAQSTTIQITILLIIIVFVFWGVGTNQGGNGNAIATVNDQGITYQEYQRLYEQTVSDYRERLGGNLPSGLLETLGIKQQVLKQLIQKHLMQQGAAEAGLMVSNMEVRKAIQEMESFRQDGIFNMDRYKQLLSSSRMTSTDFEEGIRSDMMNGKIVDHFSRFTKISDAELSERFAYENNEVQLNYVILKADDFGKRVVIEDEKLTAFYDKEKDKYKTAPQVKLKYLSFDLDAAGSFKFSDAEIEKYYQDNMAKYSTPEQRHARHILVKSDAGDSDKLRETKRKKIETILELAKKDQDFAKLAKEYSEGPSAVGGGDLGFFRRGQMVKPFDDAVFAMKPGELSGVVETQFGFHIIKLEEIKAAKVTSLDKARKEIAATMKKEKGKTLTYQLANQAYENIILAGSLEKYAQESKTQLKETDFFTRNKAPKGVAGNIAALNAAFSLKKGELSSLLEGGDGYTILFIADEKAPEVPELPAVRARVEKDFIAASAKDLAQEQAKSILTAAKETDLAQAAKKEGLKVLETPFFSRKNQSASTLPNVVTTGGLGLSSKMPYPEQEFADGATFYVIHLEESKSADMALLSEEKEQLLQRLKQDKQLKLMGAWLAYLEDNAEITTNKDFFQN